MSPDPMLESGRVEDPQTWNRYAYVTNNPFRYIDPDGRQRMEQELDREQRMLLRGEMTEAQVLERHKARATGAVLGLSLVLAPEAAAWGRALATGLFGWALGNPDKVQEAGAAIGEGLADVPPGSLSNPFAGLGATTAQSVERKLSKYLLDPTHPVGGPKAKWFEQALGYTKSNLGDLAKQIVFDPKKAVQTGTNQYGTKYNQVITITGANGKTISVTFAWIVNHDGVARLVTAIPTGR